MKNALFSTLLLATLVTLAGVMLDPAYATPVYEGVAKPWQLGFQEPATPVMEKLDSVHDFLLVIITAISVFVLIALAYICIRFRRKANPNPSKTTHNTKLEIIWTVIPILILVAIAIPSLRIHYFMNKVVEPELTIKAVGYQWYWHYEYPDQGGFGFDSYMKKDEDLVEGDRRLLSVDNNVVVPVNTKVRVQLTGADVIHAWAVPAFGVKRDAIPGRLNETWFKATKIGRFYGQCSELCGVGHGFMPIVVDVVSQEDFDAWVASQQQEAGIDPEKLKEAADDSESSESDAKATEVIGIDVKETNDKHSNSESVKESLNEKEEQVQGDANLSESDLLNEEDNNKNDSGKTDDAEKDETSEEKKAD